MKNEIEPTYLTVEEAAKFLNLKESRLRYEIFNKRIPHIKIGRSIRFEKLELEKWMRTMISFPGLSLRENFEGCLLAKEALKAKTGMPE